LEVCIGLLFNWRPPSPQDGGTNPGKKSGAFTIFIAKEKQSSFFPVLLLPVLDGFD